MVKIVCRQNGYMHDFFVITDGVRYYLFTQKFRRGVDEFYRMAMPLGKAIKHGCGKGDRAIHRTMDKLRIYIKYIEKENDIIILEETRRKKKAA